MLTFPTAAARRSPGTGLGWNHRSPFPPTTRPDVTRGSRSPTVRRWPSAVGAAIAFCLALTRTAAQGPPAGAPELPGYAPSSAAQEVAAESRVIGKPTAATADSLSRALSREPHMAGTAAQARTRDYVLALTRRWGLKTEVRAYDVYLPQPTAVRVWRLGAGLGVGVGVGVGGAGAAGTARAGSPGRAAAPDSEELALDEGQVPGDTTSPSPQIPTFNAYSGTGTAAGEVVYVNYGLIEDYAHLDSVGVSVRGRIVLARYGHSFRGIKVREAEQHGAAAILIYTDPADDGYVRGDVYPEGPMRPEQSVQRGSVMNQNGDPSTPGYPSTGDARRLTPDLMAVPHIPSIPISARNAARLLRDVRGNGQTLGPSGASAAGSAASLPQSWQGGLPFRYHVGPGPTRARVTYAADTGRAAYHTIWDTFAIIPGSEFAEERVIVGAHRDAWGPGAADNVSGVVSVLEMARALADEAKAGHPPKRTIVLATWDAEEWGLIGSTEYVEDDSVSLARNAVAYLNIDVAADGPTFEATGSPSLRGIMRDVTRVVPSPDGDDRQSVYGAWRAQASGAAAGAAAAADTATPPFGDPGGGSDFAGFANHLGIPILAWGYGGLGTVYHSAYDDYAWESRFGDPGFHRHVAAADVGAALAAASRQRRRATVGLHRVRAHHAPISADGGSVDRGPRMVAVHGAAADGGRRPGARRPGLDRRP